MINKDAHVLVVYIIFVYIPQERELLFVTSLGQSRASSSNNNRLTLFRFKQKNIDMRKSFFLVLFVCVLAACENGYKLKVNVYNEQEGYLSESKMLEFDIDAQTKDAAIKKAKSQCRNLEMMSEAAKEYGNLATIPISAYLYKNKKIVEEIIWKEQEINKEPIVDSLKINELSPLFRFEEDDFSVEGKTCIIPKTAPKYINRNGIFCYFSKTRDGIMDFRLRIQFHSDEWLFIKKYNFSIDGIAYEYVPYDVETDSGDGKIWEWIDVAVENQELVDIIKAISSAETAKIKFVGRQYSDIKSISKKELISISNTIQLFEAMGGTFY